MSTVRELRLRAASLLVYGSLWQEAVAKAWLVLLDRLSESDPNPILIREAYGAWFSRLAATGYPWSDWVWSMVRYHDNPFARAASCQSYEALAPMLRQAAAYDLEHLQACAAALTDLQPLLERQGIPVFAVNPHITPDWAQTSESLAALYRQQGVGWCGRYRAVRWQEGDFVGIPFIDPILLTDLYGCERQQVRLCQNTEALLARQPALNVLLYGARGTGKSSIVKALLNQYGARGLRLVELNRPDLASLPVIVEILQGLPQTFILFVDDLSFEADETSFKQLKVLLEGDIARQPDNVRLYATTNRRHLIREYFGDRATPANTEVHAWDTVQEKLSLADRFGLTLTFTPFTQQDYLATIEHLCPDRDPQWLRQQGIIWAQQQNGFSGRTARQFVTAVAAGLIQT